MTASDVIRRAAEHGYSIVLTEQGPAIIGPQPVHEAIVGLAKSHKSEIIAELERRKNGEKPKAEKAPTSAELQTFVLLFLKSGRGGWFREEAERLLSDETAWEKHPQHREWMTRAAKLRASIEFSGAKENG